MLDSSIQIELCNLIMKIIEGERSIENFRIRLCDYPDFNPYWAFEKLSYRNSDFLIPRSFKEYLGDRSVKFCDDDYDLLVRQYSSNLDGRLDREDFFQLVLPSTSDITREIALNRRLFYRESANYEISFMLLIEKELSYQREIENLKANLYKEPKYTIRNAFLTIDRGEKGYLRDDDIIQFASEFRHYLSKSDIDCLLRRIDTKGDEVITFDEFLDFLLPLRISHRTSSSLSKPSQSVNKSNENPMKSYEDFKAPCENSKNASSPNEERKEVVQTKEKEEKEEKEEIEEIEEVILEKDIETNEKEEAVYIEQNKKVEEELYYLEEEKGSISSPENRFLSPRFKEDGEELNADDLEIIENYDTPEKESENIKREAEPKSLYPEISIEKEVSNLFALQLFCERRIEYFRQNLAMVKEFSVDMLFNLIDKNGQGEVAISDFEEFLKQLDIDPSADDLWVLFKRFGSCDSFPMKLTLENFKNIVNPKSEDFQFMTDEKEDWSFSEDCLRKIVELFAVIFESERKIEEKRAEINSLPEVDIVEKFNAIDIDGDGEISENDLKHSLDIVGIQTTAKDRKLLLVRYSKDLKRNIELNDFTKEVLPIISSDEQAF